MDVKGTVKLKKKKITQNPKFRDKSRAGSTIRVNCGKDYVRNNSLKHGE